MSLINFTDKHNNNRQVWLSPKHVIFVQTIGGDTWIGTQAYQDGGKTRIFVVAEDEATVVSRMNTYLANN